LTDPWANRAFLRGTQYKTDANLAARHAVPRAVGFACCLSL
jgi:hypothetical protein